MPSAQAAFQVDKYSWSDDGNGNSKASYRHLKGDNIYVVLRGDPGPRGQLSLQIIQGTAVLNNIDLAKHIDIAISTRETFRRVNRHVADKQLPTYAVTSGAKLAITHRNEDDRVNRMQVAMSRLDDCATIVNTLRHRGMVFVEASQQQSGRPATSNSDLQSVASHFTHAARQPASLSNTLDRIAQGSQSQTARPRQAANAFTASTFTRKSRSPAFSPPVFLPPLSKHRSQAMASTSELHSEPFLRRNEEAAPRTPQLDRPLARQIIPRVDTMFSNAQEGFSLPVQDSPLDLWSQPRSIEDLLPPEIELPFDKIRRERSRSSSVLSMSALPKPQAKSSAGHSHSSDAQTPLVTTSDERSSGAFGLPTNAEISAQPVPGSSVKQSDLSDINHLISSIAKPSSSTNGMQPRTTAQLIDGQRSIAPPDLVEQPILSTEATRTVNARRRQTSVAPPATPNVTTRSKRKFMELETQQQGHQEQYEVITGPAEHRVHAVPEDKSTASQGRKRQDTAMVEPECRKAQQDRSIGSMPPPPLLTSNGSRSSPKDMHELLYGKRPKVTESTKVADAQVRPSVTHAGLNTSATSSADLTSAAEKVIHSSEVVDLKTYASLDMPERKKVLDKFMVEMLGNVDFATLCRDMSTCWQSLALDS